MNMNQENISLLLRPVELPALSARPLFSILVANYNYAEFLPMALDSILAQTYGNFEAIVCDDGSTDGSLELIQQYAQKDSRIRLLAKENGGVASALNAAYASAAGELIAFLDADDVFRPNKLERALAELKEHPRAGVCAHPIQPVSKEGRPAGAQFPPRIIGGWLGPAALRYGGYSWLPPISGVCLRREIAEIMFPLPGDLKRLLDYYMSQTAMFITELAAVPEVLADYRLHGSNVTGMSLTDDRALEKFVEDVERILPLQKQFLERFYGEEVAGKLKLDDHPWYWTNLLAIRALRGKRRGTIRPFSLEEIVGHVHDRFQSRVWRLIVGLPKPLSKPAYCFWYGSSPLKHAMSAVARPVYRWLTAGAP
jgi:glycosyltransferase involved in cell wall biosynthesis